MSQLTAQDLVIGEKYIPIKKSVQDYGPLENSEVWHRALRKGQPYLFYKGICNQRHVFTEELGGNGDYFLPSDVVRYVEPSVDTYDVFGADSELQQDKREKSMCSNCNTEAVVVLEDIHNASHPSMSYEYKCLNCDSTFTYP